MTDWKAAATAGGWDAATYDAFAASARHQHGGAVVHADAAVLVLRTRTGALLTQTRDHRLETLAAANAARHRLLAAPPPPAVVPPPVPPRAPTCGPLEAWTDGSGTHADDEAGAGVVLVCAGVVVAEASAAIGRGSNNVAEAHAIGVALTLAWAVAGCSRGVPLTICSDSTFALGAVAPASTWNVTASPALTALVARLRAETARWPALALVHVDGHAGLVHNERADWLAGRARAAALAATGRAPGATRGPRLTPAEVELLLAAGYDVALNDKVWCPLESRYVTPTAALRRARAEGAAARRGEATAP